MLDDFFGKHLLVTIYTINFTSEIYGFKIGCQDIIGQKILICMSHGLLRSHENTLLILQTRSKLNNSI
jgi:hypothetical protein